MPHLALAIPIFRVTDLAASVRYYTRALGFSDEGVYRHDPSGSDGYAFLSRDGISLHLSTYRGDGPLGAIAYFRVQGIDELHDEWRAAGADILYDPGLDPPGPGNQPWGQREIYVRDLDGNVLRFGQTIG